MENWKIMCLKVVYRLGVGVGVGVGVGRALLSQGGIHLITLTKMIIYTQYVIIALFNNVLQY